MKKILNEHPEEASIHVSRADLLFRMEKYNDALIDANKAVDLDNEYKVAYITRSEIWFAMGNNEKRMRRPEYGY